MEAPGNRPFIQALGVAGRGVREPRSSLYRRLEGGPGGMGGAIVLAPQCVDPAMTMRYYGSSETATLPAAHRAATASKGGSAGLAATAARHPIRNLGLPNSVESLMDRRGTRAGWQCGQLLHWRYAMAGSPWPVTWPR